MNKQERKSPPKHGTIGVPKQLSPDDPEKGGANLIENFATFEKEGSEFTPLRNQNPSSKVNSFTEEK